MCRSVEELLLVNDSISINYGDNGELPTQVVELYHNGPMPIADLF